MNIDDKSTGALICPHAVPGAAGCSRYGKTFKEKLWLAKHVWSSPACLQRLGSNFWSQQWFPRDHYDVCDYCREIFASTNTNHVSHCERNAQDLTPNGRELARCLGAMQRAKHKGWLCGNCYQLRLEQSHVCSWSARASRREFIEQVQMLSNREGTHCDVLCLLRSTTTDLKLCCCHTLYLNSNCASQPHRLSWAT